MTNPAAFDAARLCIFLPMTSSCQPARRNGYRLLLLVHQSVQVGTIREPVVDTNNLRQWKPHRNQECFLDLLGRNGYAMTPDLRTLAFSLACLAAVCPFPAAAGQTPETSRPSLLDLKIDRFSAAGSLTEVLAKLAVAIRPVGVIGVADDGAAGRSIKVDVEGPATVKAILAQICPADGHCKVVAASDPRIVNVIPLDGGPLSEILSMKLTHFDMSINDQPQNWYRHIPDLAPELRKALEAYYSQQGPPNEDSGVGAQFQTDVPPPHVELHVSDVTILDILNALASKDLDSVYRQNSTPAPSGISYMAFASGWEMKLPPTQGLSFRVWLSEVFGSFPPSTQGLPLVASH